MWHPRRTNRPPRRSLAIVAVTVLSLAFGGVSGLAEPAFTDIEGNWAQNHILNLVNRKVISGYPDRTFRPRQPVTRAEFAKMIAVAFQVPAGRGKAFKDVRADHWARASIDSVAAAGAFQGYPDGTFRPNQPVTRAEVTTVLMRMLNLEDVKGFPDKTSQPTFQDVTANSWAFRAVETAKQVGVLPSFLQDRFEPNLGSTRALTAALLDTALGVKLVRGTVEAVDPVAAAIVVKPSTGLAQTFRLGPEAKLVRNTEVSLKPTDVKVGDQVLIATNHTGAPTLIQASGVITQEEVVSKVSDLTKGILGPADLRAIIAGDWGALADSLKTSLYDQLLEFGATPLEAEAILHKDWASMGHLARIRLAKAIGAQFGVSPDLAMALLNQDWKEAARLAQVEATQKVLNTFFQNNGA